MTPEDRLIARIASALGNGNWRARENLRLGIGDDAAVVAAGSGTEWALSCDAFLEGVHFRANLHPPDSVGYKALARATSDLAAMGAIPRFFLLTLALPKDRTGKWLDQFLAGMRRAAREFGMTLIGGDTTKSHAIFVSITVVGENPVAARTGVIGENRSASLVRRSGARPGDRIYVSGGNLGAAQLGLLLLKSGLEFPRQRGFTGEAKGRTKLHMLALKAHLYPRIRVDLGVFLARTQLASAMIDISDGLSTDLGRLCTASGVGTRIWAERIPCVQIPAGLRGKDAEALARLRLDPLKLALDGGEDYELLFTVPSKNEKRLRRAPEFQELRKIGEIVRGRKIALVQKDGSEKQLISGGWDPFRR